jgi:hypothetical protein
MKLECKDGVIKGVKPQRLRVFDWNTPWFWLTVFYQQAYGKPYLEIALWKPNTWKRFWLNVWQWEEVPDPRGQIELKHPDDTVLA